MNKFSQLFNDLDESTKTNDRLDHLVKYLIESAPEDSIWVCWFLAGNRIKGAIKTSELRTFAKVRSSEVLIAPLIRLPAKNQQTQIESSGADSMRYFTK